LLALWLAVVVCGFLFGWHAGRYFRDVPAEADREIDRFVAAAQRPLPPPIRPGRLDLADDPTAIDIQRHWTALERNAGPVTTPLSHVELSNWERNLARNQRAWEHKHGIRNGQD
jgi:hypothetical protein